LDIYYPREQKKPDKVKDKFIVLYFGSILPLQGVEVIMEAMDILKDDKEIYFYFIGPVKDNITKTDSDNIEYIEWLSQEKLAEYISYSDLCLAGHFNKNINKAKRTIPGKAYIYEAMNKPMILGDNSATKELYSEDEMHFFVKMGDGKALAEKIQEIKQKKCKNLKYFNVKIDKR
jgi:glycosyltransferase involved in cell wall biosynthesis